MMIVKLEKIGSLDMKASRLQRTLTVTSVEDVVVELHEERSSRVRN